jgi:drug/metabolite transporter (DMT)-like permease
MVELPAILFGMFAALSWGGGDFCGGLASKRADAYTVVLVAEFVGAVGLATLALVFQEAAPALEPLLWAGAGGLVGAVGLLALYRALSLGHMGVVAPLSAVLAGVVPIAAAVWIDGWPSAVQLAGFMAALAAVWLLTGGAEGVITRRVLGYALLAGVSFGFYFVLIDQATAGGVFWTLAFARTAGGVMLLAVVLATRRPLWPSLDALPLNLMAGGLDAAGNLFFALAALAGRLDVAAIVSSLYPGATVLLAWALLGQRLNRPQMVGVVAALTAIVLIAV